MENQEIKTPELGAVESNYLEKIKELKENSVNKTEYLKLVEENKKLVDIFINGGDDPAMSDVNDKMPTQAELRNKLFNPHGELSNLEFVKSALQLRTRVMEEDGIDIFVGSGHKFSPTKDDYDAAQRVADALERCVDYAQGDSQLFTQELMRITDDVKIGRFK